MTIPLAPTEKSRADIDKQIEQHRHSLIWLTDHAEVEHVYELIAQLYAERVRVQEK